MGENHHNLALGIDLGGTKILTAVTDERAKILSQDYRKTPAEGGPEVVIEAIIKSAGQACAQADITSADIAAIGIGAPGLSNPETGILFTSPNLPGWQDVPLRDSIEKAVGVRAFLINDANAAALGELYFGAGKGVKNLVYVTISTGIGGGIIIDNKIYTGSCGTAGELGHMVIDDNGPVCTCGKRGCWEALASGTALAKEARNRIQEGAKTTILERAGGGINEIDAKIIQEAAEAGDELAIELIAQTAYYFGIGLANIINIFNPELIVIGGGLSSIGDRLLQPAYQEAERRSFKQPFTAVRIVRAALGSNSGVIGAATYALKQVQNTV